MNEKLPMTADGLLKLKSELENLKNSERPNVIKAIAEAEKNLQKSLEKLRILQENVKALGEDKLLAVQAELAGVETQSRELDRQAVLHKEEGEKLHEHRQELLRRRKEMQIES